MTHRSILPSGKLPATILLCMMLVACSTTQKSGTGTGATQEAAPVTDATASGAQSGTPSVDGAPSAQSAQPETLPDSGAAASGTSQQAGAAADAEAERLKQQLADQEAEINRLRQEQLDSQQLADQEPARERAAATQAGQGEQPSAESQQAATSADAASSSSAAASSGADEPLPTFPEQSAAAEPLQHSVYFEFDNAVIKDEYDSMLIGHAAYLKAHPDFNAEVQGNCDERGSREYNLALGARRAEAVKRALELAGADGGKIKTVSFGAEKPVAFGQDEESYRQNRRADILY